MNRMVPTRARELSCTILALTDRVYSGEKSFMLVTICKSKIHRVTVTDADLNYEGSITIDEKLLEAARILPYEKVQVVNLNNGERFETYVLVGKAGSGIICLNGPAARLGQKGDLLIVISYCHLESGEAKKHKPTIIHVNNKNRIIKNESHNL